MMPANEYERLFLTKGKAAADAEFERQMRPEYIKQACAIVILILLIVAAFYV